MKTPTPDNNGWMPIETAPKDGTHILLFSSDSDSCMVGFWYEGRWEHSDATVSYHPDLFDFWQPLPPPPALDKGE